MQPADIITHLKELCPCGHNRAQHSAGGCAYCECTLFGLTAEASQAFAVFAHWKESGSGGPPPALPALSVSADLNFKNPCVECQAERRRVCGEEPSTG